MAPWTKARNSRDLILHGIKTMKFGIVKLLPVPILIPLGSDYSPWDLNSKQKYEIYSSTEDANSYMRATFRGSVHNPPNYFIITLSLADRHD